jgi:hypothetical protein
VARIAYLGPEGTFSEAALLRMAAGGMVPGAGELEPQPTESTPAALEAVRSGPADYACVPIENSIGLRVYRELMAKEAKGPAVWAMTYGIEALQKPPDPQMLLNLGKFSKYSSMHMPLEVQLQAIRKERNVQTAAVDNYEKRIYPQRSTIPVSECACWTRLNARSAFSSARSFVLTAASLPPSQCLSSTMVRKHSTLSPRAPVRPAPTRPGRAATTNGPSAGGTWITSSGPRRGLGQRM